MKHPIQILSIENDSSTSDVIEWLKHYNKECIRFNNLIFMDTFLNVEISGNRESDNQGNEYAFIIDYNKIENINKELWG